MPLLPLPILAPAPLLQGLVSFTGHRNQHPELTMVSLWSLYFAGTLRAETLSYFWLYLWLGLSPNGVTEAEALASILHPAVTQTSPYTRSSVS